MLAVVLGVVISAPGASAQGQINDCDDDNLIEIISLKQMNAVRWDLDGAGR